MLSTSVGASDEKALNNHHFAENFLWIKPCLTAFFILKLFTQWHFTGEKIPPGILISLTSSCPGAWEDSRTPEWFNSRASCGSSTAGLEPEATRGRYCFFRPRTGTIKPGLSASMQMRKRGFNSSQVRWFFSTTWEAAELNCSSFVPNTVKTVNNLNRHAK